MPEKRGPFGSIMLVGSPYKPGDQAPTGYLDWHEWAETQHKAGLRQQPCGRCGKWRYPQELSALTDRCMGKTSRGRKVTLLSAVCNKCAASAPSGSASQSLNTGD